MCFCAGNYSSQYCCSSQRWCGVTTIYGTRRSSTLQEISSWCQHRSQPHLAVIEFSRPDLLGALPWLSHMPLYSSEIIFFAIQDATCLDFRIQIERRQEETNSSNAETVVPSANAYGAGTGKGSLLLAGHDGALIPPGHGRRTGGSNGRLS